MEAVPRHLFVPEEYQDRAYDDGLCLSVTDKPFLSPTL